MTNQEIYNISVNHLRRQGKKSLLKEGATMCAYRGIGGLMCAAGPFIPDDKYTSNLEQNSINDLYLQYGLFEDLNRRLLTDLQMIHDDYQPSAWEEEWERLAHKWNLAYTPKGWESIDG
jgi:hypothetical protein